MFGRRLIAALVLAAAFAVPALAQSPYPPGPPPPVPALPDSPRQTTYTISGTNCSCAVNFQLYGDSTDYQSWVEVTLNGVPVQANDSVFGWTITSATGPLATIPRPITDAVLTFNNPQTGNVVIVGAQRPRRTAQFAENQGVPARALNQWFNTVVAMLREIWDKTNDLTGRGLFFAPGNVAGPMPSPSACALGVLGFDGSGTQPLCLPRGTGLNVNTVDAAGATAITNGTNNNCLYDNNAVVGTVSCRGPVKTQFYVATTGVDTGDCSLSASPCASLHYAVAQAMNYSSGTVFPQVNVACGTYNDDVVLEHDNPTTNGTASVLVITGPSTDPTCVIVNGGTRGQFGTFISNYTGNLLIENLQAECTNITPCNTLYANGGSITYGNIRLGNANGDMVHAESYGSFVQSFGTVLIAGTATAYVNAINESIIGDGSTLTCSGNPVFSNGFATAANYGIDYLVEPSFIGCSGVVGKRYSVNNGGLVTTPGQTSLTFLPGSLPGQLQSGGRYVGPIDVTSWTGFTPTFGCNSGTLSTPTLNEAEYRTDQLTTFFTITATLNTISCSSLNVTLPTTPAENASGSGFNSGKVLGVLIGTGGITEMINYDNSAFASGNVLTISGSYPSTGP